MAGLAIIGNLLLSDFVVDILVILSVSSSFNVLYVIKKY